MNEQISYKLATMADIDLVVKYRFALLNEISGRDLDDMDPAMKENMENYFARAIPGKSYICWLGMDGDKLAGIGGVVIIEKPISYKRPSGLSGYIMGMYTVKEYRKRGICSTLIEKLVDTAKEMQLSSLDLHATDDGEKVYRKHGFKEPKNIVLEKLL